MVRNDVSFAHCTHKRINYVANKFISAHSLALLGIFFIGSPHDYDYGLSLFNLHNKL